MKQVATLLLLAVCLMQPVVHATDVGGNVCDEVWSTGGSPYVVVGDVTVLAGCSLTIEAAVAVRFQATRSLQVEGRLSVEGTSADPVTLMSDSATPGPTDWGGVRFNSSDASVIQHAELRHGTRAVEAVAGVDLELRNVTLRENQYGLYVYGPGPPVVDVIDSEIVGNTSHGVYLYRYGGEPNPQVTIQGSSIHGNLGSYDLYAYGFENPQEASVDARGNWWGSPDPALFASRIYERRQSTNSPVVDWCDYLDGPGGVPALDSECVDDYFVCDETIAWTQTVRPYQLVSDLYVCPTGELQVGPGVEVWTAKATSKPDFLVEGILWVEGTPSAPVILRSAAAAPAPQDWQGLRLGDAGSGHIEDAFVLHAKRAIDLVGGADVDLLRVTLRDNQYGLYVYGPGPPVVDVIDSEIVENTSHGVYLYRYGSEPNPQLTIHGSSLHGNLGSYDFYAYGFDNPAESTVDARGNWWGSADPGLFASRIYERRQSANSPVVDWCDYLDGPAGLPAIDAECLSDYFICDETATWLETARPYLLISDLYVCPTTGVLEVGPGVEVRTAKAATRPEFLVEGVLRVNGTAAEPVTFGSAASVPAAQDWQGLRFGGAESSLIEHAVVSHAVRGVELVGGADLDLRAVTLRENQHGLYVYAPGPPTVEVIDSEIVENTSHGVYLYRYGNEPNPQVTIHGSSLHGNLGSYDLYAYGYEAPAEARVDVRGNWWGSADTALFASRIYGRRQSANAPVVDWCDYLDGPGGVPARDRECVSDYFICDEPVVWSQTSRPYLLVSDLYVCPAGILEVHPGVEVRTVKAASKPDFLVEGVLSVEGTPAEPVIFTSDATTPAARDWYGIRFGGVETSHVSQALIEYAERGVELIDAAEVVLDGSILRRNQYGIYVYGDGPPTLHVLGAVITENTQYGAHVSRFGGAANPLVTFSRSAIHSNLGSYDLYTYGFDDPSGSIVWALDNWWGTSNEASIRARIYDWEDNANAPHVWHRAIAPGCETVVGRDLDGDGLGEAEDNCIRHANPGQQDADMDRMGDLCDPSPDAWPLGDCDGFEDSLDGFADSDGDGWGDPCDPQPARDDSYPGAPERCDGRDNDGQPIFALGELTDQDQDLALACGDCDDFAPDVHSCMCEACDNTIDDDCDGEGDPTDSDCTLHPYCIVLSSGTDNPHLTLDKGTCGGASVFGPCDVVHGTLDSIVHAGGIVDLGAAICAVDEMAWDHGDYTSTHHRCDQGHVQYFLGKYSADSDYGQATGGDPRRSTACP